jgi:hypothetical protein
VTQPLDVGCFGPLKNAYYSECQAFLRKTPGIQINKFNVASISGKAYNKGLTADNLVSSFRKTGIYPLERKQISEVKTAPSTIYANESPNIEKCESEKENNLSNFLDSRKITKVVKVAKKRKSQPSIYGNIMSPSKQPLLKQIQSELPKPSCAKNELKHNKQSPKPSTSAVLVSDDNDTDYSDKSVSDEDLCCVCGKFTPEALNLAFTIEFVQWGQCDSCNHWTHLKYCTKVRFLRRDSQFLCPHCEK